MPKSETSNPKNVPSFEGPRYRPRWFAAVVCFVLGTLLTVALLDYAPRQSTFVTTHPLTANLVGLWGANTVYVLLFAIGISTWLLPLFLYWLLYISLRKARRLAATRLLAMLICIAALAGLVAMFESIRLSDYFPLGPGGWLGVLLYQNLLKDTLGVFGTGLILGTIYVLGLMFIFTRDIGAEFERILHNFQVWKEKRAERRAQFVEAKRLAKDVEAKRKTEETAALAAAKVAETKAAEAAKVAGPKKLILPKADTDPLEKPAARATPPAAAKLTIVKPEETRKAKAAPPARTDDNYEFPPLSLLKDQVRPAADSDEEHKRNADSLVRILGEFGVAVTPGEIHVGPVITCYEVAPAPGVRVEKIAGLDKNIALGMSAQSVRILAPIPGKAAVGVEIPNRHATPVGLREILESEDWAGAKAEIPIALGKDVGGRPLISDLTRMPHLLIAGATGSGKSVCINSIIASILYGKSPRQVRLLMVDPKVVELKIFNSLPHMLIPVVTEPKKVPAALKWLLGEMEQRYQIFAKVGVRNISGFNARKKGAKPEVPPAAEIQQQLDVVPPADDIEVPDRLPYIVAIIDELADLMMVAPAEIETSIARLAQLARAAGIHLIIATQRPSVNVITGVIKANLPSRIAFQVASQVDSRTILDTKGADTLIGRGDMLFSPPGTSRLVRAQGAFVADEEVSSLVEFLKKNGPPVYASDVQAQIDRDAREDDDEDESGDALDGEGDDDELYRQALDVIKATRRASTSMLQRRLRIGYNRAARLMEQMEDKGIVGPENGSSPRDILADLDKL